MCNGEEKKIQMHARTMKEKKKPRYFRVVRAYTFRAKKKKNISVRFHLCVFIRKKIAADCPHVNSRIQ